MNNEGNQQSQDQTPQQPVEQQAPLQTEQSQVPAAPFAAPSTPQQPFYGAPQQSQQAPIQHQETDVLGILSLVFIMLFAPIGLILGFVGLSQAKKKGYSNTLSLIGTIINGIFTGFILLYVLFVVVLFVISMAGASY